MASYSWLVEPYWIEVRHELLAVKNLALKWDGKKIALISDLHFGPVVNIEYLKSALLKLRDLGPDAVIVGGDWLDCHWSEKDGTAKELLGLIPQPEFGVVGVLGNHDYGIGNVDHSRADHLQAACKSLGFKLLKNQSFDWDGLAVIGLDDLWGSLWDKQGHFKNALAGVDPDQGQVILCHNPDGADLPLWNSLTGWILSGHTHGGQVRVPFYGPVMSPVNNRRYIQGYYAIRPGLDLWITRGLGYIRPVRFRARPEITMFQLCSRS